ncbi:MAG: right-handed parallel beta-helix repeat-containing protein [Acidimicrobiia bacterium]
MELTCGATVTESITLTADIGPCPDYGLRVGADNITIDLGGHRIFGTASPRDGAGVFLFRRSGVTVRNGTVEFFDAGVAIEGGSGNAVRDMTIQHNIGGLRAFYGDGVAILSSTNNVVAKNIVRNNGGFSGIGLYTLVDGDHPRATEGPATGNQIVDNQVLDNRAARNEGPLSSTDNDGIRLEPNTSGNLVSRNLVRNSGLDAIALFSGASHNIITLNNVQGSGMYRTSVRRGNGIIVFPRGTGNLIEGNTAWGNADNGILLQGPTAAAPGATGNTVRGNIAFGNSVRPPLNPNPGGPFGGPTFDLQDRNVDCDNNTWLGNRYRTAFPACTTIGGAQI